MSRQVAHLFEASDNSVRQKIIKSAIQLFTTKGYAATSVREIVEASGVTKPVMYYYFKNKEGLFMHLVGEADRIFSGMVEQVRTSPGTAREKLFLFFTGMITMLDEHRDIARVLHSIEVSPQQGAPAFDHHCQRDKFRDFVMELLAEAVANGELRRGNLSDYAWVFLGIAHIHFTNAVFRPETAPKLADVQRVMSLIWDALAASATAPAAN